MEKLKSKIIQSINWGERNRLLTEKINWLPLTFSPCRILSVSFNEACNKPNLWSTPKTPFVPTNYYCHTLVEVETRVGIIISL